LDWVLAAPARHAGRVEWRCSAARCARSGQLDPERLRAHGVGIAEAVGSSPGHRVRGARVIDRKNQRLTVRAEGQVTSPALLGRTAVREHDGGVLRLEDLGRVVSRGAGWARAG
jgi:Cu/Ag efflux pump CusA